MCFLDGPEGGNLAIFLAGDVTAVIHNAEYCQRRFVSGGINPF